MSREVTNILLFLSGKLISLFGQSVYTFAVGLYVLNQTGSGLSFAITLILGMIPTVIIMPFAGVLADRMNRKFIVILMDFLNATLFFGLYLMTLFSPLNLFQIYLSTFIMTIFTTVFAVSMEAALPDIVSGQKLLTMNSLSKIVNSLSLILGPVIGGLIYALADIQFFILINGFSFLLSAILEIGIDFKYNQKAMKDDTGKIQIVEDIKEAFQYMQTQKQIFQLFVILISVNFFISLSISVPLPYIINNVLKLSPNYFGIIEGAFSVGVILGAVLIGKLYEKVTIHLLLFIASLVLAASMLMIGLPVLPLNMVPSHTVLLIHYSVIMSIMGIVISFIDIPLLFILQKMILEKYRGRVLSLGISLGKIISPLGLILSGLMISTLPSYFLPVLGGVLFLFISMIYFKRVQLKFDENR